MDFRRLYAQGLGADEAYTEAGQLSSAIGIKRMAEGHTDCIHRLYKRRIVRILLAGVAPTPPSERRNVYPKAQ